jgi:hypothetical protein
MHRWDTIASLSRVYFFSLCLRVTLFGKNSFEWSVCVSAWHLLEIHFQWINEVKPSAMWNIENILRYWISDETSFSPGYYYVTFQNPLDNCKSVGRSWTFTGWWRETRKGAPARPGRKRQKKKNNIEMN